jgi:hypothetical protein
MFAAWSFLFGGEAWAQTVVCGGVANGGVLVCVKEGMKDVQWGSGG